MRETGNETKRKDETMTTTTATILEETTAEMEIMDGTSSDVPGLAQKVGEQQARKYRAQGHACECIGVVPAPVEVEHRIPTGHWLRNSDGLSSPECRSHHTTTMRYQPVIFPKAPSGE